MTPRSIVEGLTPADLIADTKKPQMKPYKRLSGPEMEQWNQFQAWLEQQQVAGSKDLDNRNTNKGRQLMEQYAKANPGFTLTYDRVPDVQYEFNMANLDAQRRGGGSSLVGSGGKASRNDGWLGSLTSKQRFVPLMVEDYQNGQLQRRDTAGLMNGSGQPLRNGSAPARPGVMQPAPAPQGQSPAAPNWGEYDFPMKEYRPVFMDGKWMIQEDDGGNFVPVETYRKKR